MNDDGYTLVRIPGSDAIYRLPAGCPVTDENLRRFGERVTPPAADVVSDPPDLVTCASATRPAMPIPDTIVREVDTGRALRWTGGDWVDDIVAWVEWAFDRAEQRARDAMGDPDDGDPWTDPYGEFQMRSGPAFDHIVGTRPSWRLADLGRKRKILAEHEDQHECRDPRATEYPYVGCTTVRLLAAEFDAEPGYDAQRWAP